MQKRNEKINLDKRIVVTGGGSGGHVSVAIAILDELEKKYENTNENIVYVGSDLAMEGDKTGVSIEEAWMKDRSTKFIKIRAGKLQRTLSLNSLKLVLRTILGFLDAYTFIKRYKPDLVFSTGGFVTVPVALSAWINRIPVYLHEQTAAVGLANKIVGKIAKKIYITFPQSEKYFNRLKTYHTGNIIREAIFSKTPLKETSKHLSKMEEIQKKFPIIYISGGGQGSHLINLTVRDLLPYILLKYQIILQTGDNRLLKDYEVLCKDWKKISKDLQSRLYVTKYIKKDDIGYVLNIADLFIGRAGANTVYELGVLQIPSILIPIPWVTHNEQEKNAKILQDVGLAKIIHEGELSPNKLNLEIDNQFKYKSKVNENKAKQIFTTNALKTIINDIVQ